MQATPMQLEAHKANLARRARLWTTGMPNAKPQPVEPVEALEVVQTPWGAPVNLLTLPTPQTIIRLVALKHQLRRVEVIGHCRARNIVTARHEAIGLVSTHCKAYTLQELGRMFGNRDHSTILHALRKRGLAHRNPALYRQKATKPLLAVAPSINALPLEDRHSNEAVN